MPRNRSSFIELLLKEEHTPAVLMISYGGIAMKRLILISLTLLVMTTSLALAEWTEVGSAGLGTDDFIFWLFVLASG